MAKRINLHDHLAYRRKLSETVVELDEMADWLYSCMVGLAMHGKWKEWADANHIGLDYEFTEDMLRNTGDTCIDALIDTLDSICDAIELLTQEAGDLAELPPEELPF
ncbi:MAG: hypothetical protein LBD21_00420 [Tannerellaceae bacterium]|jgi:hypothetical protein|nr:hypothetical protein [Tannerellaceae bacterium]